MKATFHSKRIVLVSAVLLLGAVRPGAAQLDPDNVPRPPAERLAALESFFGSFEHSGQYYAGLGPWEGTVDVGTAVKGWYVELVINTVFGPIDRQLRMLVTWDQELGRYRVWRFETSPQMPPGTVEAEGWFEGHAFIMEWRDTRGPDGGRGIFRNTFTMEGPDELVVVTRVEPDWGDPIELGTWRNVRVEDGGSS
ncbi:MAG: hypothetical protein R3195_10570 [Gemmatimonadota bacterium]|nr:hypothetical protein [Gemmatimonadota bacterium]